MPYKYIYIDDTFDNLEQGTINGLEYNNDLEISFSKPDTWEKKIEQLKEQLKEANGLLLDLRLNDKPYSEDNYANYRGSTLAQELRTLAKEKLFPFDFPIILISANDKLDASLDKTSYDLFDLIINKNDIKNNGVTFESLRARLVSLAHGYDYLNKAEKKAEAILNYPNIKNLDNRFLDTFSTHLALPTHIIARFVLKQVLEHPSLLIDEHFLSARLGVARDSKDWLKLSNQILEPCKYSGAFSDYYQRWWMPDIINWWESEVSSEIGLRNLTANNRISLIQKKYPALEISKIEKSEKSKSDSFWTVCKATKIPIDTIDGFIVAQQDHLFPWQEKEYISTEEALRPQHIELWKSVSVIEKNRLQKLKDMYGKIEQRVRR